MKLLGLLTGGMPLSRFEMWPFWGETVLLSAMGGSRELRWMISSRVIILLSLSISDSSLALATDESLTPYAYWFYSRAFYLDEIDPERLPGLVWPGTAIYSLRAFLVLAMMSSLTRSCSDREYVWASLIFSCTSCCVLLCS